MSSSLFTRFKAAHPKHFKNDSIISVEEIITLNNLNTCKIASVTFFILNLCHLVINISKNFYSVPKSSLDLFAVILMMISSAYIFILSSISKIKPDSLLIRSSLIFYYISIVISVEIFSYIFNMRAFYAGAEPEFTGITISTFYLIIFILAPLPAKSDSAIVLCAMLAGAFAIQIFDCCQAEVRFMHFAFHLVILVSYIYFRKIDLHNAENTRKIHILNADMESLSYTDTLTKVLNRNAMHIYTENIVNDAANKSLGVILFDIDNFKSFNDTLSHKIGDDVLYNISQRIISVLGEDDFIFRFGGEEFIILTKNRTDTELINLARACKKAVADIKITRKDNTGFLYVTISAGCANIKLDNQKLASDYVADADNQLYFAKSNGKNCVAMNNMIYR